MAPRRIFIAVDISDEARRRVVAYIDDLRTRFSDVRVRWERPEKLHFTLKFLGHVDEERVAKVETVMRSIIAHHKPFVAGLEGTGVFANVREPRILWIGMGRGKEELVSLAGDIEAAIEHLGFARDTRRFSPHLTIGRIREPRGGRDLAAAHISDTFAPTEFSVEHITIYESVLGPTGSTYSVVSRIMLG